MQIIILSHLPYEFKILLNYTILLDLNHFKDDFSQYCTFSKLCLCLFFVFCMYM